MTTRAEAIEDELPGGMALQLAIQAGHWPHTMDASVWAEEFCKRFPSIAKDEAVGWFANAIMSGYDTAGIRLTAERDAALRRAEAWKSAHSLAVHAIGSPAWQEALKEARALDALERELPR